MKQKKPYWEMNAQELDQATSRYDKEELGLPGAPLTAEDESVLARAAKPGRPRIGKGAKRVLVSVERGLLADADAAAHRLNISRSEFIARGLRAALVLVA